MEENINPEESKLDKYTEERVKKGIETLLNEKELKIKWRKELEDNPAVVNYFNTFRNNAMDDFMTHYLNVKHSYYTYGDMYKKLSEKRRDKWIDAAHEQLNSILQKQLFDKQCLWRAEQITFEEVEIAADFELWSNDIFNCPFLEPVNWADIEMYIDFLNNSDINRNDLFDSCIEWQNFSEFKAGYTSSEDDNYLNLPEWYDFHNSRTENSTLLLMQDIRGEKEGFYIDLYFEDIRPQRERERIEHEKTLDKRPYLSTHSFEHTAYFISTFENKECQKQYKYYHEMTHKRDPFEFSELIEHILNAEEPIPISSHYNLIDAVELAYNAYYNKKVAEHLPIAFEQYLLTNQLGFKMERKKDNYYQEIREIYANQILKGRELNGEPQNFDF
ncbi:hypothetical protein [Flavobacterium sp. SM2513]|uniref:hypothetical protein n=1 Tax=Flavobacterium sp. SM2513 TaxID=3424766 RepID=UPI003D7FE963